MHVLASAPPGSAWTFGGSILTFAFPMILFIGVAGALWVLYTKPELVPGHQVAPPERPVSYTPQPGPTPVRRDQAAPAEASAAGTTAAPGTIAPAQTTAAPETTAPAGTTTGEAATTEQAATGDATTGDATTGDTSTGDAATGHAATDDAGTEDTE